MILQKTAIITLSLAATILAVPGATSMGEAQKAVEAETGAPDNPECSPDMFQGRPEVTSDKPYGGASGTTMLFPHDGCSASFATRQTDDQTYYERQDITRIRYVMTGRVGQLCGHFDFNGAFSGSTAPVCRQNDEWVELSGFDVARSGAGDQPFTLTWRTDSWDGANAYLDFFVASNPVQMQSPPPANPPPPPPPPPPSYCETHPGATVNL